MNPEDSMDWCKLGMTMSDREFALRGEEVVSGLAPGSACLAGVDWPSNRFDPHAKQLVELLSTSSYYSCEAGIRWSDHRFFAHADKIVEGVVQDLDEIFSAVEDWDVSRVKPSLKTFVDAFNDSPEYCSGAAICWDDQYFKAHEDTLVNGFLQSAKYSREAGAELNASRYYPHSRQIIDLVSENPRECLQAVMTWPKIRLPKKFIDTVKGTRYEAGALISWGNVRELDIKMSEGDLELSREAFSYAKGNEEEFYHGLWVSMRDGTTTEWAQHIIDHFKKGTIGGGNYREVFR